MKLSDARCRNARSTGVPYKLADGHGLYLYVAANGSRLWRVRFFAMKSVRKEEATH
jgi:hypothetical protein